MAITKLKSSLYSSVIQHAHEKCEICTTPKFPIIWYVMSEYAAKAHQDSEYTVVVSIVH